MAQREEQNADVRGCGSSCLVLMYHYVYEQEAVTGKGAIRGLDASGFRKQLDWLCRHLEPVDWPVLFSWSQRRAFLPSRSFLLTFDDGLACHADVARLELERRGLRGTFFVPGCVLVRPRLLTVHALHILLARLGEEELVRALRQHLKPTKFGASLDIAVAGSDPPTSHSLQPARTVISEASARTTVPTIGSSPIPDADFLNEAARIYHYESPARARIKYLLNMALPRKLRTRIVKRLFEEHVGSSRRWAETWYLSWESVNAMQSAGHTIGGHGFAHEPLAQVSPRQQKIDLSRSLEVLTQGLGPDVRPMSYPFGSFNESVEAEAMRSGFAHAFTTQPRWTTAEDKNTCLPRVDVMHLDARIVQGAEHPSWKLR